MAGIEMKTMDENMKTADAPEKTLPEKDTTGHDKEKASRDGLIDDLPSDGGIRGHWTYNWEFIVAAIAFNVEFGTMFRLAYTTYRSSGVLFLGIYSIFLLLTGVPMFYLESCLGQFFGKGPCHIWNFCPLFRGVGVCMVLSLVFIIPYYGTSLSWMFVYFFSSFSSSLPWTSCHNYWNTPYCHMGSDGYGYNYTTGQMQSSPIQDYFEGRVLQIIESPGIGHLGSLQWELVGYMIAVNILIFAALFFGVKVLGKVLCVMLLLTYVSILILLVRAVTLDGASQGLKYFLYPTSFRQLLQLRIWDDSFRLALFSNGVSVGAVHTLASYKKFKTTALRDSFLVCVVTSVTCFITGIIFFSFFGALALLQGVPIEDVVTSEPFLAIPGLFAILPGFQFWSALYFLMLLLSGLSTQIVAVDVLITAAADFLPRRSRNTRFIITAVICLASFILSLPYITKGGYYLFILVDHHILLLAFSVLTLLQCITVCWIYGIDQFSNDIQMMTGIRPPVIFKIIWSFILPLFCLLSFVGQLLQYFQPSYKSYVYPVWSVVIGWIISLTVLVPLPVFFVLTLVSPGRRTLTSNADFGPANPDYKMEYRRGRERPRTVLDRLMAVFKI